MSLGSGSGVGVKETSSFRLRRGRVNALIIRGSSIVGMAEGLEDQLSILYYGLA